MIEAGLEFPSSARRTVVETFLSLPAALRPTHRSTGEEDVGARIRDPAALLAAVEKQKTGFFLKNEAVTYSIRLAGDEPLLCDCFLEVQPMQARTFMLHMAEAQPVFGFACRTAERESRNRITMQLGANTISSWVGRDTRRYVPGLYWLTLLPATLAAQHDVPLEPLETAAIDRATVAGDQSLFQFFDSPDDWNKTDKTSGLIATIPGIFDLDAIRPRLTDAKTFLALNAAVREWK